MYLFLSAFLIAVALIIYTNLYKETLSIIIKLHFYSVIPDSYLYTVSERSQFQAVSCQHFVVNLPFYNQTHSKLASLTAKLSLNHSGIALNREVQRALVWAVKCLQYTFITSLERKTFLYLQTLCFSCLERFWLTCCLCLIFTLL